MIIGAAGFAMITDKVGTAPASELPPGNLVRNTHKRGSAAVWNNPHEFTNPGIWVGNRTCLYFSCHLDNELLKFVVGQVLWTYCQ